MMVLQTTKALIVVLIIVGFSSLTSSCYYDKEELLYPDTLACDTIDVSFAASVEPLFELNCYACHSNAQSQTAGAGISLEGHANVSDFVKNNADRLLGSLKRESGFSPMPKGGAKLEDCDINKLSSWISAGANNN